MHGFNALFLRPGSTQSEVELTVTTLMAGRSFSMHRVEAAQSDRGAILELLVSAQDPTQAGPPAQFEHQQPVTLAPRPEQLRGLPLVWGEFAGAEAARGAGDGPVLPPIPGPEQCITLQAHMAPHIDKLPTRVRGLFDRELPIEIRPTEYVLPWDGEMTQPGGSRAIWLKTTTPTKLSDDGLGHQALHQLLFAYICDWG